MAKKKSTGGRPPKGERLVKLTINLPAETVEFLGQFAQAVDAAGTASIARQIIQTAYMDAKRNAGSRWAMPDGEKVTTGGKS